MDMAKIYPSKPFLVMLYGYPGAGKTYFARQFCDGVQAAHVQADRIRAELFTQPRYDKQENDIVNHLMEYMTEEFLSAGLSVAYDVNAARPGQRKKLRDLAYRCHATPLIVWFQMDQETAFARNVRRDRRRADDRYAAKWDRSTFDEVVAGMQNPRASEDYTVISGKHVFPMQQSAVVSKLRSMGVITSDAASEKVIKPGLVNLVPKNPGRFDPKRRIAVR